LRPRLAIQSAVRITLRRTRVKAPHGDEVLTKMLGWRRRRSDGRHTHRQPMARPARRRNMAPSGWSTTSYSKGRIAPYRSRKSAFAAKRRRRCNFRCLDHTQTQPQMRRPRRHQQRQTRRRRQRRGPGPTQTCVFSVQSSRESGMRPSSGIALVVSEGPARPAAATAAPNKIPRVKARRSISFIERLLPYGARVLCGPTVFSSRAAPAGSGSRFRYEKMLDWSAIDAIVHDKKMISASHAAPARASDGVFPKPLLHPRLEPAMERIWGRRRDGPESNMATALQR
jgi:hypothetical protein